MSEALNWLIIAVIIGGGAYALASVARGYRVKDGKRSNMLARALGPAMIGFAALFVIKVMAEAIAGTN